MRDQEKKYTEVARWGFCLIVVLMATTACNGDDAPELPEVREFPGVDERLWPYFIRFEDEAEQRGVSIDLREEGITGVIEIINEENVAGTCNFNGLVPNHVMIDEAFFNAVGDIFREFIIFHELGHCSLFRDHLETQDHFGRCTSLMRSGVEDCRDNYSTATRSTYLDELFDPQFRGDIFTNQAAK